MRNNKGVTLSVLIVTVIILLILAGIMISSLKGDEGIITRTRESTSSFNDAVSNQIDMLEQIAKGEYAPLNPEENELKPDNIPPLAFEITSTGKTDTTITISGTTTDAEETEQSGSSGIAGYKYQINNGEWTELKNSTMVGGNGTYTFTGLTPDTEYTVKMKAVDYAGNETETSPVTIRTFGAMPELVVGENITFTQSEMNWVNTTVNGPIIVTISQTASSSYGLQYRIGGTGEWAEYQTFPAQEIQVLNNNTIIEARLADLVNGIENGHPTKFGQPVSETIDHIDNVAPVINTGLTQSDSTPVTLTTTINVTDSLSGLSKIIYYIREAGESEWETVTDTYQVPGPTGGAVTAQEKNHTFENLAQSTDYEMYAEVYDVAGNMTTSGTSTNPISVSTGDIPALEVGTNIEYELNTTDWTNQDVIVTLDVENSVLGSYTLRYKIGENGNWTDYDNSTGITVSSNGTVYVALYDGTSYGDSTTIQVTKIDKTNPVVNNEIALDSNTSNSITATVTATDSLSGIGSITWYYRADGESEWQTETDTYQAPGSTAGATTAQTKTHTFEDLAQSTEYEIYAEVYDVAGNKVSSGSSTNPVIMSTGTITALVAGTNITFGYSTTNWTNQNVTVTLTVDNAVLGDNTLRYKIGINGTWTDYDSTNPIVLRRNDTVYASLYDGSNYGESATGTVSKIDKTVPIVNTNIAEDSQVTGSIVTTITVTDSASGLGKIIYYYKASSSNEWLNVTDTFQTPGATEGDTTTQTKTHTFTELAKGTVYQFYAEVYDVAGNMTTSYTSSEPLEIETLSSYSTEINATNITINVLPDYLGADGTTYQYQLNGGNWVNARLSTDSTHTFTGLTPETSYTVNVKIGNEVQTAKTVTTQQQKTMKQVNTVADAIKYSATAISATDGRYDSIYKALTDSAGETVKVPVGFTVRYDSAKTVDGGIVVADGNDNQWVWIPVNENNPYVRENFKSNGTYSSYSNEMTEIETKRNY